MFTPRIEILPGPQRRLWGELSATPDAFTLYGGTAIALRLGHRFSVDFDFFSPAPFAPAELMAEIRYLEGATLQRMEPNTLTVMIERDGPVQLRFLGGLRFGQVEPHEIVEGPGFNVASLVDLAGTKVATVTQRVETKDYLDIHALLKQGRIPLPVMLAAASIIYGEQFNPLVSLKAICYHHDLPAAGFSDGLRRDLVAAVRNVDPASLPKLDAVRAWRTLT